MIKNKKSQEFITHITIILLLWVAVGYLMVVVFTETKPFETEFGDIQIKILNVYSEGEKTLFYIDQSAKYSAQQAIYDLSQNGGFLEANKCGDYLGYNYWKTETQQFEECKPSTEENFKLTFNTNLNKHFDQINSIYKIMIPKNNYLDIKVKDNLNIIGIADKNLIIPIGEKPIGIYSISPSFNVNTDYDLDEYNSLSENLEIFYEECRDDDNKNECIKEKINTLKDFDALDSCETEEQESLLKFAEYYESCSKAKIPITHLESGKPPIDCICRNKPQGTYYLTHNGDYLDIIGKINDQVLSVKLFNVKLGVGLEDINNDKVLYKDKETGEVFAVLIQDIKDSPKCELRSKTKFRFCAQSNKHQIFAYDEEDEKTALRDIVYKFVLEFEKPIIESREEALQALNKQGFAIDVQCANQDDKIVDIVKKVGEIFEDRAAPILFNKCSENDEAANQRIDVIKQLKLINKVDPILLILSSAENPELIYVLDSGEPLADILAKEFSEISFSHNTLTEDDQLYGGISPHTIKISFESLDLEDEDNINDYSVKLSTSLMNYALYLNQEVSD